LTVDVVVLGAGLTGLSAGYHLETRGDVNHVVLERDATIGGLARSLRVDGGFVFDRSIHILYTSDPYCDALIRETLLPDQLIQQPRESYCYSSGVFTEYPYQLNNFGLPASVITENLLGLIDATYAEHAEPPKHYEDWLYRTFGRGIADNFMIPYNRRQWAWDLTEMGYDWIAERVPVPDLREVIHGALERPAAKVGPNREFWYPAAGGIDELPKALAAGIPDDRIRLETEVVGIDLDVRRLRLADGSTVGFDHLISSSPLPALAAMIDGGPAERIRELVAGLRWNRVHTVNVGLQGEDLGPITDMHWVYFPDPSFPFHRLSLPHRFSPEMVPSGCASIQFEVSESRYQPIRLDRLVDGCLDALVDIGVLVEGEQRDVNDGGRVRFTQIETLDPAYVIYDLNHRETVDAIRDALRSAGVWSGGRFGEWEYFNMDHSILSGKRAVDEIVAAAR
jgi:UDP-galactopyranose mutase